MFGAANMSDRERLNPFGEGPIDQDPFHELEGTLAWYDRQFEFQIAVDPDPAYVELSASLAALGTMLTFLANCGIKSRALSRLHIALTQVHSGGKQPAMLAARAPAHRLPDNGSTQILKGGLAAIMRLRQSGGDSRERAAKWVVRHMLPGTAKKLRLQDRPAGKEWETVAKWADRFGNDNCRDCMGRTNYLRLMRFGESEIKSRRPNPTERLLHILEKEISALLPSVEVGPLE
jgi:hypothetical protein